VNVITSNSTNDLWPAIVPLSTKMRCLTQFREAMAMKGVRQNICTVCASLNLTRDGTRVSLVTLISSRLLCPEENMPECITEISLNETNFQMTGTLCDNSNMTL